MNEITIGDKTYISSKRAAEITGYAKDYVGQLCREGHIEAKMVGRGWYVYEPSIRAHRFGVEAEGLDNEEDEVEKESSTAQAGSSMQLGEVEHWQKPVYTSELPQELPKIETPLYVEPAVPTEQTLTDMQAAWREWFEHKQEISDTREIAYSNDSVEDTVTQTPFNPEHSSEATDSTEVTIKTFEAENPTREDYLEPEYSVPGNTQEEPLEVEHYESAEPVAEPETGLLEGSVAVPIHTLPAKVIAEETKAQQVSTGAYDVIPVASQKYSLTGYSKQAEEGHIVEERIIKRINNNKPAQASQTKQQSGSNVAITALLVSVSLISVAIAAIGSGYANNYFKASLLDNSAFGFLVGDREYIKK